jgi:N6-L-threonylcarbamoyladenine synthase
MRDLVVCGGVAANKAVRARLQDLADKEGLRAVYPPPRLCTDNGVMAAWAAIERLRLGCSDDPTDLEGPPAPPPAARTDAACPISTG